MGEQGLDSAVLKRALAPVIPLDSNDRAAYLALKGIIDRLLAAVALIVGAPLIAVLSLSIKIDSKGPIIFRQQRVGRAGRLFTIFKFRTMSVDAPTYSYKIPIDDPRITRVGRWLRRTGLDEFPQLWNVVRGDMSLIGPRPELPFIVDQYQEWQLARLAIRPGITGWWQVHHRNGTPMHLNLEHDIHYLENMSLGLDCLIALQTIKLIVTMAMKRTKSRTPNPVRPS